MSSIHIYFLSKVTVVLCFFQDFTTQHRGRLSGSPVSAKDTKLSKSPFSFQPNLYTVDWWILSVNPLHQRQSGIHEGLHHPRTHPHTPTQITGHEETAHPFRFISSQKIKKVCARLKWVNVGLYWKSSLIVKQNIFNTFLLAIMQIKTGARIICLISLYRKMGISMMLHPPGGPHATQAIFYRNGWRFSREGFCSKKNCKESPKGDRSYLDQWARQELRAHLWKMTCGSPYPSYSPSIIHAISQVSFKHCFTLFAL